MGNLGCFPCQLLQGHTTQPNMHAGCFSVSVIHRTLDVVCRTFNMRTYVNACDCTRGCVDTIRESALKGDSGRRIPCHTKESNLRDWRASPVLYH